MTLLAAIAALWMPAMTQEEPPALESAFPPAELAKVRELIAQEFKAGRNKYDSVRFPEDTWRSLGFEDRFIYTMINGEHYYPTPEFALPTDVETYPDWHRKLIGWVYERRVSDTQIWSDRQIDFLRANRKRLIPKLREMVRAVNSATWFATPLSSAIAELDAWELMPDLAKCWRSSQDLTPINLLDRLMTDDHYKPFLASAINRKVLEGDYSGYIAASTDNVNAIIRIAMAYYRNRTRGLPDRVPYVRGDDSGE